MKLQGKTKVKYENYTIYNIPLAYEIVSEFRYEDSSYLCVWTVERDRGFLQGCFEASGV